MTAKLPLRIPFPEFCLPLRVGDDSKIVLPRRYAERAGLDRTYPYDRWIELMEDAVKRSDLDLNEAVPITVGRSGSIETAKGRSSTSTSSGRALSSKETVVIDIPDSPRRQSRSSTSSSTPRKSSGEGRPTTRSSSRPATPVSSSGKSPPGSPKSRSSQQEVDSSQGRRQSARRSRDSISQPDSPRQRSKEEAPPPDLMDVREFVKSRPYSQDLLQQPPEDTVNYYNGLGYPTIAKLDKSGRKIYLVPRESSGLREERTTSKSPGPRRRSKEDVAAAASAAALPVSKPQPGGGVTYRSALEILQKAYKYPVFSERMRKNVYAATKMLDRELDIETHVYPLFNNMNKTKMRSLFFSRTPVYIGGDTTGTDKLWERLQTEPVVRAHIPPRINITVKDRIVVAADVPYVQLGSDFNGQLLRTVHAYGLNFESGHTADYAFYFKKRQHSTMPRHIYLMWRAVILAATRGLSGGDRVHLRVPAIGLGAYAIQYPFSALPNSYWEELKIVLKEYEGHAHLQVVMCILDKKIIENPFLQEMLKFEKATVKIKLEGDLFGFPKPLSRVGPNHLMMTDDGEIVVMVNAWDTNSWIGNGMEKDRTVDGMFVADATRPYPNQGELGKNPHTQNASFWINAAILFGDQERVHIEDVGF